MLRYLTAGESHGKSLVAIIEGMPANLNIDIDKINCVLRIRQTGYGRGERMKIEHDEVEFISGVRNGKTLGSPICIKINNRDWKNNKDIMDPVKVFNSTPITVPRPGHADLAGSLKYNQTDLKNIFERASARETAIRTAVGSIAQQFLNQFGICIYSHVVQIGIVKTKIEFSENDEFLLSIEKSLLRCGDKKMEKQMIKLINETRKKGDTLGGIFEIVAVGVPIGLGSCMHWDRKLDAKIAYALMSIQGIKGVEFGKGFGFATKKGSQVHDEIFYSGQKFYRKTNNAGGIEGGMSNGENIIIRAVMKPIPTLRRPLKSIDLLTKQQANANVQRADVCAVPAASIVGQSVVAWELASAFLDKFGGDSIEEVKNSYENYLKYLKG